MLVYIFLGFANFLVLLIDLTRPGSIVWFTNFSTTKEIQQKINMYESFSDVTTYR